MNTEIESGNNNIEQSHTGRRRFLGTVARTAGLVSILGPAALQPLEAAAQRTAGLTPEQAARDEYLWRDIQQAFSMSRSLTNLDNAWTCPSPRVVTEAMIGYIWDQEQRPAQQWIQDLEDRMEVIRVRLAGLFGANPDEIAITRNATESLKTVLYGYPLKAGDEVLTTRLDYGSMVSVLRHRQRRDDITVNTIDTPAPATADELTDLFARAITPKTRLILTSHMAYLNGQVFPADRICRLAHEKGIDVVVDGAHSFAHLTDGKADIQADFYGSSLHKWLLAPKGTGMLYIRKDRIQDIPALAYQSRRASREKNIRKYESVGTQSMAPFLAIGEAIMFHEAIGAKRKEERLRYLTHYWADQLKDIPGIRMYTSLDPAESCGIATVGIEGVHPVPLRDYLWEEHHIQTARIERDDFIMGLRISPNVYTTLSELDAFCEQMAHVAQNGLPDRYHNRQD